MPLLLVPVLLVAIVLLWLLLLPLAMWQRYRAGGQRRRALRWAVTINAWALSLSALVFLGSAWLSGHWIDAALPAASGGLAAGLALGVLGLALTRFEATGAAVFYTPNRWLALALTLLVLARLVHGGYRLRQAWAGDAAAAWLAQQGSVLAVGGLLLGYYLAYAWGLRARLRRG